MLPLPDAQIAALRQSMQGGKGLLQAIQETLPDAELDAILRRLQAFHRPTFRSVKATQVAARLSRR